MNAWPSLQTILYDGWVIRLANGHGNRANSVNPIYPSKTKLEEKLEYCDKLFTRRNLLTTYKLVGSGSHDPIDEHKAINSELEKLNYTIINETSIQMREIPKPLTNNYEGMIVKSCFDPQWIESVIDYNRIEEEHVLTFKNILGNILVDKIVVRKEIGDEVIGCGYGAIENDYVGVFDIVIKEEHRNKGYGREIVETIMFEAGKRGVKQAYLQVLLNNPVAWHLYEKMGFKEVYQYWYRKKTTG